MKSQEKAAYTVGKKHLGREYETDNRLHDVLDRNRNPDFIFSAGDLFGGGSDCFSADCGLLSFLRINKGEYHEWIYTF